MALRSVSSPLATRDESEKSTRRARSARMRVGSSVTRRSLSLYVLLTWLGSSVAFTVPQRVSTTTALASKPLSREDEIRRKIMRLKKQGKIQDDDSAGMASYEQKIKQKLGKKKSKLLGFESDEDEMDQIQLELDQDDIVSEDTTSSIEEQTEVVAQPQPGSLGRIGALPDLQQKNEEKADAIVSQFISSSHDEQIEDSSSSEPTRKNIINPDLFDDDEEQQQELSDEELAEIVAEKMAERRKLQDEQRKLEAELKRETAKKQREEAAATAAAAEEEAQADELKKTTSGVGGTWSKEEAEKSPESKDYYKPKSGSWGAFPRPRNISTAYGGGRRIGEGYSKEDQAEADLRTKERLKNYRIKAGIEVPSEAEHAEEIEEALNLGQMAMRRGVYPTAVSALEKVTPWCSTNSKVGSKVFLELAMAYEAVGRPQEAYQVYQTLSTCRMEDVKFNAKRLLYGMEAMEVMKEVSKDFSRKKIKSTFMDATGLDNFSANFDDRYQTAYVDLSSGYYKRLTESVVRSNREARQILLKATGRGEVGRLKIVQALRSISRLFDDALAAEIESNTVVEPTAMMNGKPIVKPRTQRSIPYDEFNLASPEQTITNLQGMWRLQLLADRKGDGVSFFNNTESLQVFNVDDMFFQAAGKSGFVPVAQSGEIELDGKRRILTRKNIQTTSGGNLLNFLGAGSSGFAGAVSEPQQIVIVDSMLLVTKRVIEKRRDDNEAKKEFFAVWRKQEEDLSQA